VQELKGFARIALQPGESKRVIFHLPVNCMAFYDAVYDFVLEPGRIKVMLGSSSQDIRLRGEFTITGADKMKVAKREFSCPVQITEL
jgi:beta-glucosidase